MYTITGSADDNREAYYAHVGFIVDINGSVLTTVEGNLSNTIESPTPYDYLTETNIGGNNYSVLGFASPTWA